MGKIFTQIEKVLQKFFLISEPIKAASNAVVLKESDNTMLGRVVVAPSRHQGTVVVKQRAYKLKNFGYQQLHNEASMLRLLNTLKAKAKLETVTFPKLYNFSSSRSILILKRQYVEGQPLTKYTIAKQISTLKMCLKAFEDMTRCATEKQIQALPKRTTFQVFVIYHYYLLKVFVKDLQYTKQLVQMTILFYRNFHKSIKVEPMYVLSHRDLHNQNILMNKNKITILDPEVCMLAEGQTDIAIIARYYYKIIGTEKLLGLLSKVIINQAQYARFLRLTLFYTIIVLGCETKNSDDYTSAKAYFNYCKKILVLQNVDTLLPSAQIAIA